MRADQPQPWGMPWAGFVVAGRGRHRDANCVRGVAAVVSGVLVIVIHWGGGEEEGIELYGAGAGELEARTTLSWREGALSR